MSKLPAGGVNAPAVAFRKIRAVSDPQKPEKAELSAAKRVPLWWSSLTLLLVVLDGDHHLLKIESVCASQLL
jgi:hypothetical protein